MKIINFDELPRIRETKKQIVLCHGVFDLLHPGHLAYFKSAKKFGGYLIVSITTDKHVNKGPGRPRFNSNIRAQMVAELECVDSVVISDYPTAIETIKLLKPDFYAKGPDYKDKTKDLTGMIYEEEKAVIEGGGELVFTEDETLSSSNLINEFFNQWTYEQDKIIKVVKNLGGMDLINKVFERVSQQRVCVAGEPIVDTYVFCNPENLSSKFPAISANYLYEEDYLGGSLAVANHLADFVKSIDLIIADGNEKYFNKLLDEKMDKRVNTFHQDLVNCPTPRKVRFIANDRHQRIFELTLLKSNQWDSNNPKTTVEALKFANKNSDCTLLCDFGHGFFASELMNSVYQLNGFITLNVQTNSSNYGFNVFTKHHNYSYLTLDVKEARLAFNDRHSDPGVLCAKITRNIGKPFSMTLGANGSKFVDNTLFYSPAFASNIIDATGAGDAFFAITSLLLKVDCPRSIIPFIGNVFAGLKTKIIGNKSSVTKAQLFKSLESILK